MARCDILDSIILYLCCKIYNCNHLCKLNDFCSIGMYENMIYSEGRIRNDRIKKMPVLRWRGKVDKN